MISFDTNRYFFDEKAAQKVVDFIEKYITHVKGELAGQLIKLENWQKEDIIKPAFGIKIKESGLRRFRTVYVEIPRKNSKSTMGGGLALYLLLADGELGAEIYSAAGDRNQAGIIFDIAKGMVMQNSELNQRCETFQHSIKKINSLSFYKVISADARTKHGFNASGIIFDELHTQPSRDLWDTLQTSRGSRLQPITFAFTTAGTDKESICYEQHDYALKLIDGIIEDETFLPVIYKADENKDIFSEDTWKLCNPGYGTIVKKAYIQEQINIVKNEPSFESTFRRLHLNQWVGTEKTWIPDNIWMKNTKLFKPEKGMICYAGLDLSRTRDITAFVLLFPLQDGQFGTLCYFFVPEEMIHEKKKTESVQYDKWLSQGFIIKTPGNVIDYEFVKTIILDACSEYQVKSIAYDRYGAVQLVTQLTEQKIKVSPFGQGYVSISAPTKELERMIYSGKIQHSGNPVLRWMASNVMILSDPAGNIKIAKNKSKDMVDGIVALTMAVGEWMTDKKEQKSIYEDRGILTI